MTTLKRISTLAALTGLVITFGAAGCGDEMGDDSLPEVIDSDTAKADSVARPLGTYRQTRGAGAGDFSLLVLKFDKTFHYETQVVCVRAPCPPISTNGTYKYSSSGHTRYIRFLDGRGGLIARYAYTLSGESLTLRKVNTTHAFTLTHSSNAWCSEVSDCEEQAIITPACVGGFSCEENGCKFHCGIVPPPACQPVLCELFCENGFKTDDNGCEVCSCNEAPPVCPAIRCAVFCEFGNKTDANGCQTCTCNEDPQLPATCGGPGEHRPRGGCPEGYSCNCPNGAACFVAGTCHPDQQTGERCGNNTCAVGDVCCNPLQGICTPPGGFCIQ